MAIITIEGPVFYSQLDEKMFFESLGAISGIADVRGEGTKLRITKKKLSAKADREFEGLLRRYKIGKKRPNQPSQPTPLKRRG